MTTSSSLPARPVDLTGPILLFVPRDDAPAVGFAAVSAATVIAALEDRLARGADVNAVNPILGKLALCEVRTAAEGQGEAVVRWLLDHGADPSGQDRRGNTALHHYLYHGVDAAMVAAVLAAGPDLTGRNSAGLTVLDVAARRAQHAWIAPLVAAGADPNAAHPTTGFTALHEALQHGALGEYRTTVLELLNAGADPEHLDAQGRTPAQACPTQPCVGWAEIRAVIERRALRATLDEMRPAPVGPAHNGASQEAALPVAFPVRERRRLLIGAGPR